MDNIENNPSKLEAPEQGAANVQQEHQCRCATCDHELFALLSRLDAADRLYMLQVLAAISGPMRKQVAELAREIERVQAPSSSDDYIPGGGLRRLA